MNHPITAAHDDAVVGAAIPWLVITVVTGFKALIGLEQISAQDPIAALSDSAGTQTAVIISLVTVIASLGSDDTSL